MSGRETGWLSTRNKTKMKQIQARILKTRSSTLKPLKQTPGSHSPPPKQLFTATKQSSLNDFFHSQHDYHLEVELNFEDTNEDRNPDTCNKVKDNSPYCESRTSYIDLDIKKVGENKGIEREQDANGKVLLCSNRYEGPFENIKIRSKENKSGKELRSAHSNDHVSGDEFMHKAPLCKGNKAVNATEITYGSGLTDSISLKRKCTFGELDKKDENKRTKVQEEVSEGELSFHQWTPQAQISGADSRLNALLETTANCFQLHSSENVFDSSIEEPGSYYENCRYMEDMSVPLPCFGSQSLDFGSQLSSRSQSLEHGSHSSSQSQSLDLASQLSSQSQSLDPASQLSSQSSSLDPSSQLSSQSSMLDLASQLSSQSQSLDLASQLSSLSQSLDLASQLSLQSQSLDLASQLSPKSSRLDLGSVNSLMYDAHTDNDASANVKHDDLTPLNSEIRDTQIKRLQACIPSGCLTFSSQNETVEIIGEDLLSSTSRTLSSQIEVIGANTEAIT